MKKKLRYVIIDIYRKLLLIKEKQKWKKIKVTLLGDSIRAIGYGLKVPEMLGDEFEVYQPEDNCRFAKYTLRGIFDWQEDMAGSRIVHWNNGLWDICNLFGDGLFTSESEYVENMARIADVLVSRYEKVIFATITPVTPENPFNSNADISRYNAALVPILKEKGVIINDLYATLEKDVYKYIRTDDNLHLSDEGIDVCAKQVTDIIKKTAATLSDKACDDCVCKMDNKSGAPI